MDLKTAKTNRTEDAEDVSGWRPSDCSREISQDMGFFNLWMVKKEEENDETDSFIFSPSSLAPSVTRLGDLLDFGQV